MSFIGATYYVAPINKIENDDSGEPTQRVEPASKLPWADDMDCQSLWTKLSW